MFSLLSLKKQGFLETVNNLLVCLVDSENNSTYPFVLPGIIVAMNNFDPIAYINEPRWQQSRLGLDRIHELLDLLERPQDRLRFVHVAGTNGKGSTSTYLAAILQAAEYKTGLFTSPYIEHFCDRIKIDACDIPLDALREVTLQVKAAADEMVDHPTEFELMTAVAFLYFAQENCNIVVAEVGMGGRLDSTNVIARPEIAIITALGLDHQDFLGDTLEKIAGEKAGIIKLGAPVVSWPQEPEAMRVIEKTAKEKGSVLVTPDFSQLQTGALELVEGKPCRVFGYRSYRDLRTSMVGAYQPFNAAVAIEVIEKLRATGWDVSDQAIRDGIAQAFVPGRFEVLNEDPLFIIDGAHNSGGIEMLRASLKEIAPDKRIIFVVGILEDKNYETMLETLLSLSSTFVTITPPNPRALTAEQLAATIDRLAVERGHQVLTVAASSIEQAIDTAIEPADDETVICACGSLYSIAEIKSGFYLCR